MTQKLLRQVRQVFLGAVVTILVGLGGTVVTASADWVIGVNHDRAQAAQERAVIVATDTANYTAINQVLLSIDHRLSNIENHLEYPVTP